MEKWNFGRNVRIESRSHFAPKSESEVLSILNENRGRSIRCIGRLHSWSQVLDSHDVSLDLSNFNGVRPNNAQEMTVEVGAGCQIKRLLAELEEATQWTLPSVGFITEQTIAGAISTGTHGSGRHSLSHYVTAVRVARYDQQSGHAVIVDITEGDELRAARCSLGCLGVILSVTMQFRPKYLVEEHFREYEKLDDVLLAENEYPLQQFYLVPWRWTFVAQHRRESQARASKAIWLYHWYRFLCLDIALHFLVLFVVRVLRFNAAVKAVFRWLAPACVIRNWIVTGPSSSQLVMEHELFRHVETELFVQRDHLPVALNFLRSVLEASACSQNALDNEFHCQLSKAKCSHNFEQLRGKYCHHYPICIRKILPDDTLISMASNARIPNDRGEYAAHQFGQSSVQAWYSITLTNYDRGRRRQQFETLASFLGEAMQILFNARPHWGKLCNLPAVELRSLYPAFDDFRRVCDQADLDAVFRNPWTDDLLQTAVAAQIADRVTA